MKQKIKIFTISFFSLLIAIASAILLISVIGYYNCLNAVKNMPSYEAEEYLRIKIYGSSETEDGDTISGTFSIIDLNGNEIAVIERSWNGSYLTVEFIEFSLSNKKFIFPSRIYGRRSLIYNHQDKKSGTKLEKYYNENNECILLGYNSTKNNRKQLYTIAHYALDRKAFFGFTNKKTITIDLSVCTSGKYYSVVKDYYGNLVVKPL